MSTTTTQRYGAHKALEKVEWLEKHMAARPDNRETRERVANELNDLRWFLTKLISGAFYSGSRRNHLDEPEPVRTP